MSTLGHRPGPNADRAFTVGLWTAVLVAVGTLFALLSTGLIGPWTAALAAVLGLPVYTIYVSCLLTVWLGYDRRV